MEPAVLIRSEFIRPQIEISITSDSIQARTLSLFHCLSSEMNLRTKEGDRRTYTNLSELEEVLKIAESHYEKTQDIAHYFETSNQQLYVTFRTERYVEIFRFVNNEKKLGKGNWGKVVQMFHVNTGEHAALKLAKSTKYARACEHIFKEYNNLLLIHTRFQTMENPPKRKWTKTIQAKPYGLVHIPTAGITGFIGKLYSRNYLEYSKTIEFKKKTTKSTRLLWCRDVAMAVYLLAKIQIIHGDIKPDNILCQPGKRMKMVLTDFGDTLYDLSNHSAKLSYSFYSPEYVSWDDVRLMHSYGKNSDRTNFEAVRQASNVFALGMLMHIFLTNLLPFPYSERKGYRYPDTFNGFDIEGLKGCFLNNETQNIELFKNIFQKDISKRPTLDQIFNPVEKAFLGGHQSLQPRKIKKSKKSFLDLHN